MRVTVVCGWLDADPGALAEDLVSSSPEVVSIIAADLGDDENDIAGHLRRVGTSGADHAIVVAPPGAHPHHIRHLVVDAVTRLNVEGADVTLNALAAVVDIAEFFEELANDTDVVDELGSLAPDGDDRSVAELLVDQIETADTIVLRGTELVTLESAEQFRTLLYALNPTAAVETCLVCALDPIGILRRSHQPVSAGWREPAWLEVIDGRLSFLPMAHGVNVCTWRSRWPLDPLAFHRLIDDGISGLIRARGFFWLASRPHLVGSLSVAGASTVVESCGAWWAATPHDEWPADPAEQQTIAEAWDPVAGDRSNDVVFIGIEMDEAALLAALAGVEVHDLDGVLSGRRLFVDPFDELGDPVANPLAMIDDWGPPYPVKCN